MILSFCMPESEVDPHEHEHVWDHFLDEDAYGCKLCGATISGDLYREMMST